MAKSLQLHKFDWWLIGAYLVLICCGWMNVYSSVCGGEGYVFDFSQKYGMHLIWIATALVLAISILFFIPSKTYSVLAYGIYFVMLILLLAVIFLGVEINGSHSWFAFGPVRLQPAEFSKISTSFAIAALLSKYDFSISNRKSFFVALAVILTPMLFIVCEKETGSALVYLGFLIVLYREGMSGWILLLGLYTILLFILSLIVPPFTAILISLGIIAVIYSLFIKRKILTLLATTAIITLFAFLPRLLQIEGVARLTSLASEVWLAIIAGSLSIIFILISLKKRWYYLRNSLLVFLLSVMMIFSVDFVFHNVLKEYQQARIETLLGIREDPMGAGYNVHQSLIAIGSGGLFGKGFLQGTQTRMDFIPEQSTDFIFCTVGEEWGFVGACFILFVYLFLILRIFSSAEKQTDNFNRIYGYCVGCCILMHVMINIGMTLGLMPVIGIPLPFLSYGGSSLWSFTILLFIYIRLDYDNKL